MRLVVWARDQAIGYLHVIFHTVLHNYLQPLVTCISFPYPSLMFGNLHASPIPVSHVFRYWGTCMLVLCSCLMFADTIRACMLVPCPCLTLGACMLVPCPCLTLGACMLVPCPCLTLGACMLVPYSYLKLNLKQLSPVFVFLVVFFFCQKLFTLYLDEFTCKHQKEFHSVSSSYYIATYHRTTEISNQWQRRKVCFFQNDERNVMCHISVLHNNYIHWTDSTALYRSDRQLPTPMIT